MYYKPTYSKSEIEALLAWIEKNKENLPKSMDLGHGQVIKDMNMTLKQLMHLASVGYNNPTFSGPIKLLYQIKEIFETGSQST